MTSAPVREAFPDTNVTSRKLPPLVRMAAIGGVEPTIKRYLDNGGCTDLVDQDGRTMLWLASAKGHSDLCKLLLRAGADPLAPDSQGVTVEVAATRSGCPATIELVRKASLSHQTCSMTTDSQAINAYPEDSTCLESEIQERKESLPVYDPTLRVALDMHGDEFEGLESIDLNWSPESDSEQPAADPACMDAAVSIQDRISQSTILETDTDWSDVEVLLPTIRKGQISYHGVDEELARYVTGMLQEGQISGSVPSSWIKEAAMLQSGRIPEDEADIKINMLMAEFGIQSEDWNLDSRIDLSPDGEPDELNEEVLAFLSCLSLQEYDDLAVYYHCLGTLPLLTTEEEQQFGRMWMESKDPEGLDRLIKGNLRFVVQEAKKFRGHQLDIGDLVSEGNLGLIEGAMRFDPTRGNRFLTYASWWVRQSLFRALFAEYGAGIRVPQKVTGLLLKFRRCTASLERNLGHKPTTDDLVISGDFSVQEVAHLQKLQHSLEIVNLHECTDAPIPSTHASNVSNPDPGPLASCVMEDDGSHLQSALATLSSREQDILCRHFGLDGANEETLEEIGQAMVPPISRERVRQIENKALATIQKRYPYLRDQLRPVQRAFLVPALKLSIPDDDEDDDECK